MIIERVRCISVDSSGWPVLFCFVHLSPLIITVYKYFLFSRMLSGGSLSGHVSNKFMCYNPSEDQWTSKLSMMRARMYHGMVSVNDKVNMSSSLLPESALIICIAMLLLLHQSSVNVHSLT